MSEKVLVPTLGESITEATVSKWIKNKGDTVNADEGIVELETDKVNLEVPAPISGILTEVNSKDGDTVEVKGVPIRLAALDCPEKGTPKGNYATKVAQQFEGEKMTCTSHTKLYYSA